MKKVEILLNDGKWSSRGLVWTRSMIEMVRSVDSLWEGREEGCRGEEVNAILEVGMSKCERRVSDVGCVWDL